MTKEELEEIEKFDLPPDVLKKLKGYVNAPVATDEYSAVTFENEEQSDIKYTEKVLEDEVEDDDKAYMQEVLEHAIKTKEFELDVALDSYDPNFPDYVPSQEAFEFFNVMRLVEGGDFEFNTPVAHYFMVDLLLNNITDPHMFPYSKEICEGIEINYLRLAFMCSRGVAKSSVVISFFGVYSAIKGTLPNGIGKVWFYLVLAASSRGGARVNALAVRAMCEESEFLLGYFEDMRFTETETEFVRKGSGPKKNRSFLIRYQGVGTGVRGIRYGQRRICCHTAGTVVTTEYGTYPVEEHPGVKADAQLVDVVDVKLRGIVDTEVVSTDHKYWTKLCTGNKCVIREGYTGGRYKNKIPRYTELPAEFTTVTELTDRHWIGSRIDYTIEPIQPITHRIRVDGPTYADRYEDQELIAEYMLDEDFWWVYGLWLGDGSLGTRSNDLYTSNKGVVVWYVADTQRETIGKKLARVLSKFGMKTDEFASNGCYRVQINKTELANWLRTQKGDRNSEKNMVDWVLKIDPKYQKQLLLGYIAADGYIEYKHSHIRINSVNLNVLKQLQVISSRLGLPTYIRNTKQVGETTFPSGNTYKTQHQWELRLKENVGSVLDVKDFVESTRVKYKQVHIKDGMLWRQVQDVIECKDREYVYPIECNNASLEEVTGDKHAYETYLGISHNCIVNDDIILNEAAAYSKTITENLESVIHSDSVAALKGGDKGRILNCFTPFSYSDVNTRLVLSGAYTPCVIPLANSFDAESDKLTVKDIQSTWESYHPSRSIVSLVRDAKKTRTLNKFMQERMLRLTSDADRLIPDRCIDNQWYNVKDVEANIGNYNIYVTTDYTSSSGEKKDFSGRATWAISSNDDWFLLDLALRKMDIPTQYRDTLDAATKYKRKGKYVEIGVEIDGNQQTHIHGLSKAMQERGSFFTYARQKDAPTARIGILSRNGEGVKKHERFRIASVRLLQNKVWFPNHLKDTPDMKEMIQQLKGATHTAFSRADDGPDLITQMDMIDYLIPIGDEAVVETYKDREGYIWEKPTISAYDSY